MVSELVDFFMAPLRAVDIHDVIGKSIDRHEDDIVSLNQSQLQEGKLSDGTEIKPFYKPITIVRKKAKGQPTGHVTLQDKNKFYQGFYTKRVADGTEVSSSDPKTAFLEARYTINIFGLSVPKKEQLAARLLPTIQDNFNQAIGL